MKKMLAVIATVALIGSICSANATVISVDDGLHTFSFGSLGSSFSTDFSFVLTSTAYLTVSDLYVNGDQFDITNFGSSIGSTSLPVLEPQDQVNGDFSAALADPYYSKGSFTLGAGSYDISGTVLQNAVGYSGGGGAGLELTSSPLISPVPLPASAPMFGGALLAFGAVGYGMKRKKAAATA